METIDSVREITKGSWVVRYLTPFCCGVYPSTITIESEEKPTEEHIRNEIRNYNQRGKA